MPLVFDAHNEVYDRHRINLNTLSHLESLGFIQFERMAGFTFLKFPKKVTVHYYGRPLELTFPKDSNNELSMGHVLLTRAGYELAPVCGATPVDGFFDFVYYRWEGQSLVPKR